jgi:PHS family inorganic phosphate transporter-like MFS transporter
VISPGRHGPTLTARLQIAFYGLGLNQAIVLTAIGWAGKSGTPALVYDNLYKICVGNIILTVAGLIPGYWASFLVIDKWGRKPIQYMGFIMLTIIFSCMVRPSASACVCARRP